MMHMFGWGVSGAGFPLFGLIPVIALGFGVFFLIRRRGDGHVASDNLRHLGTGSPTQGQSPLTVELFRLAKRHHGVLTVSEVVAEMGVEPDAAEALLDSVTNGHRVAMEVDDNGKVSYTFRELIP